MSQADYDVVVIGYGPTGQTAASLLSRLGHRVGVFERWPSLYGLPRLCTLDGEAARILQAGGDVDAALRDSNPCRRYRLVNEQGDVLMELDWDFEHISGFPYRISMHQPDIEDALDAAARERGADVHQGWDAVDVRQGEEHVEVSLRQRLSAPGEPDLLGESRTVTATYLIAADGANSTIRRTLAIEPQSLDFRSAWLVLDTLRRRPLPTFYGSEDMRTPVVVCAPEGRGRAFIPIGASRMRFEFYVDPDSDHTEHVSHDIGYQALLDTWGLTPDDIEIYRTVTYPFVGQLTAPWRTDRIFLAGDAAHVMTPFLGQGACSGMRDAINLAWKLDLVLSGRAPDSLLDSYEPERGPHVRQHVLGSDAVGKMACELDAEIAAKRDEVLLSGHTPPPPPDPVLEAGVLHRSAEGAVELPAGDLGPQGVVSYKGQTGRFDDIVGWGFQVIVHGTDPDGVLDDDRRAFLADLGAKVIGVGESEQPGVCADVSGAYARFFAAHAAAAVIVRPDFYIFGIVRDLDELGQLVDELRHQLAGSESEVVGSAAGA